MNYHLSPKIKRNISRILPFGFIWLIIGCVFLFYDYSLTGYQNINPETDITLTIPVFIFALSAIFTVGLIIGTMEMVVFEKRFKGYSLLAKISSKLFIYLGLLLVIILITYSVAESIQSGLNPVHPEVRSKLSRFLGSLTFLNTILQLAFQLFLSLIYAAISENLGHNVLKNFFTGRYHTPKNERRIFMFLDMKHSTTIAEKLGHVTYFDFLQKYYDALSDSIINHSGEVYQYVGDEIVITWEYEKGIHNNNWLNCFIDLKRTINSKASDFEHRYHQVPDFRAGIHVGEVTAGEIGALKKEIVFTGDVLNTAARLQAMGKEFETDLVFSEDLNHLIGNKQAFSTKHLGEILLRGKSDKTGVFTLNSLS